MCKNRKYQHLKTGKDFHTAPYINYTCITVILTLFQNRIEFESQSACIINVWGCVEILPKTVTGRFSLATESIRRSQGVVRALTTTWKSKIPVIGRVISSTEITTFPFVNEATTIKKRSRNAVTRTEYFTGNAKTEGDESSTGDGLLQANITRNGTQLPRWLKPQIAGRSTSIMALLMALSSSILKKPVTPSTLISSYGSFVYMVLTRVVWSGLNHIFATEAKNAA